MFVLALEWTRGQVSSWMGCGCIPPVQLGAVAFELCFFLVVVESWQLWKS